MFKEFAHRFHLPNIIFENRTKVRLIPFNISVIVPTEISLRNFLFYFKVWSFILNECLLKIKIKCRILVSVDALL